MLNNVSLMGRLTADPELKSTTTGISVTTTTLAVDRDYTDKNDVRPTDFIPMVFWRGTAEFFCRNFHKGDLVAVRGSIQSRSYSDKDGNKRVVVEVTGDDVYFAGYRRADPAGGDKLPPPPEAAPPVSLSDIVEE